MTYLLGNGFVEFSLDTVELQFGNTQQMNLKTSGLIARQDLIIAVDVVPMTMAFVVRIPFCWQSLYLFQGWRAKTSQCERIKSLLCLVRLESMFSSYNNLLLIFYRDLRRHTCGACEIEVSPLFPICFVTPQQSSSGQTRPELKFHYFPIQFIIDSIRGISHKCLVCIRYCTLTAAKTSFQRCGFQGWSFDFFVFI